MGVIVSVQVENPLQKFLATALNSQQQQDQQQDQESGSTGNNPGKQSTRGSSSNSNQSEISSKRQAAGAATGGSGEVGGLEAPPNKRSPGRPPGSPNKVSPQMQMICCL